MADEEKDERRKEGEKYEVGKVEYGIGSSNRPP